MALLAVLAAAGTARADDLCTDLERLIAQSAVNFADITGESRDERGDQDAALKLEGASHCSVTERMSPSAYQCRWVFPYRAASANETFGDFIRRVEDCLGPQAVRHEDRSVNHPDHYALQRFETAGANVSLSLKDKAAYDSTFVFIRVQGTTESQ